MTVWRLQNEPCPFETAECKFRGVHDYMVKDGEFIATVADNTKYWCTSPDCPIASINRSCSTHDLWKAYEDHRIRFMVDGKGNPVIKIERTGEVVRSQDFTTEHLERARHDPPSPRDHTGRLKPGVKKKRLKYD